MVLMEPIIIRHDNREALSPGSEPPPCELRNPKAHSPDVVQALGHRRRDWAGPAETGTRLTISSRIQRPDGRIAFYGLDRTLPDHSRHPCRDRKQRPRHRRRTAFRGDDAAVQRSLAFALGYGFKRDASLPLAGICDFPSIMLRHPSMATSAQSEGQSRHCPWHIPSNRAVPR